MVAFDPLLRREDAVGVKVPIGQYGGLLAVGHQGWPCRAYDGATSGAYEQIELDGQIIEDDVEFSSMCVIVSDVDPLEGSTTPMALNRSTSSQFQWGCRFDGTASPSRVQFNMRAGSGSAVWARQTSGALFPSGPEAVCFVGRSRGNGIGVEIFRDGEETTTSNRNQNASGPLGFDFLTTGAEATSGVDQNHFNGLFYRGYVWLRDLSDAEIVAIAHDPWQIYEPEVIWHFTADEEPGGELAGEVPMVFTNTGLLVAEGALSGASALTFSNTGIISGLGDLGGASAMAFDNAGDLSADTGLAGEAAMVFTNQGEMTGGGELSGQSALAFSNVADVLGTAQLSGEAALAFSGTAELTGAGIMTGQSNLTFTLAGVMTGDGRLVGASDLSFLTMGRISDATSSDLVGDVFMTFDNEASMQASGALAGVALVVFGARGDLTDALRTDDKLGDPTSRVRRFTANKLNLFAEDVATYLARQEARVRKAVEQTPRDVPPIDIANALAADPVIRNGMAKLADALLVEPETVQVQLIDMTETFVRDLREDEDIIAIVTLIAGDERFHH